MPSHQHSHTWACSRHHHGVASTTTRHLPHRPAPRAFSTPPFHSPLFLSVVLVRLRSRAASGLISSSLVPLRTGRLRISAPSLPASAFPADSASPESRAAETALPRTRTHSSGRSAPTSLCLAASSIYPLAHSAFSSLSCLVDHS